MFFFIFILFFWVLKCKSRKNIAFFVFLKVYGWRKSPKTKKTQSTHKTKNQKTKTLKRLFGLASKHVFLVFILFFFGFEMQKQKKHCVFFVFLKVYGWRKSPKTKKTQSKHKTKNQKTKTLMRLFGLASKNVFFDFHFVFFGFEMQKQKKHCVFLFFEGLWLEKITKHKKKQVLFLHFKTQKKQGKQKTSFATKPKSLFKVVFFFLVFGFEVLGLLSFSTYYKLSDVPR